MLIGLLRTLWRLSYQDMHDWRDRWPDLAFACGLPLNTQGLPRIPSKSQQCKRRHIAGAPLHESLFVLTVLQALHSRLIGARDLIIDSAPILAWRHSDPDAAGCRMLPLTIPVLFCEGTACTPSFVAVQVDLSSFCSLLPIHTMPLLRNDWRAWAVRLSCIRPHVIRLDAAYWGLRRVSWIHNVLGAVAIIPWNPGRAAQSLLLASHAGPEKNWANAAVSSASLGAFFSSFAFNGHLCTAGPRLLRRSP